VTAAQILLEGFAERHHEVRGARVRLFTAGEGPALLLLHGFGGAAWNFDELAPLIEGRRLLIPDLPGHGGSAPLPAPSLAGFADLLAGILDAEGVPQADVLGHSLGGVVAVRLAVRHPDRVRRLILAAPAGISSATRAAELTIRLVGLIQPGRIAGRRADRIARSPRLRRAVFGPFEVSNPDALSERAVHGFLRGPTMHTDALGAGVALSADDPRADLGRVQARALILWGARDRQVPVEDGHEYARRLGAPLRLIADCGHLLIGERPDACARAVADFFA
jgi:pimeloyl-ACP methyl ester carboxylesterase